MNILANRSEENDEQGLTVMKRSSTLKRKLIKAAIAVSLVLICVLTAWIAGRVQGKSKSADRIEELLAKVAQLELEKEELINTPIVVNPVAPEIVMHVLNEEMGGISELATMEYWFTDVVRYTDSKQIKDWNVPLTQKTFTMQWDGVIKAGIQLDQVQVEVDEAALKIIVSMPAAEILSYSIDYDTVQVLNEKDNIFNKITLDDRIQLDEKSEEAMKEKAIDNGLLEKASENAESVLTGLIMSIPETDGHTIEFKIIEESAEE